jgi:hypothetical protein
VLLFSLRGGRPMPPFLTDNFISAIVGALVGSIVTAGVLLYQTWWERRRTKKAIATALLWEIDEFYKTHVQTTCRALERAIPSDLGFHVRTPVKAFTVYDTSADKIGLFQATTVKGLVMFYVSARAFLNLVDDYGQAMARVVAGDQTARPMAITLLHYVKQNSLEMVAPIKLVTQLLAKEAGSQFELDPVERMPARSTPS